MKRIRKLPSPALLLGVIAIVLALAGTAVGAKKLLGLGSFRDGVKDKTVGVGKLRYVTNTVASDNTPPHDPVTATATCPANYKPIGGGVKLPQPIDLAPPPSDEVLDSYMTATGWTGHVHSDNPTAKTFTIVVACARSRDAQGTPPAS